MFGKDIGRGNPAFLFWKDKEQLQAWKTKDYGLMQKLWATQD